MRINYPQTIINKSDGLNQSENYLSWLCDNTFLSLWSYPNIYRNQGQSTQEGTVPKGQGKELCDLLVVFDNHVLIFSDKACVFPSNDDLTLAWCRWYKRAVHKSADQIYGAERWIRKYPERLFLDKDCSKPFPISLPLNNEIAIHRIVVAHGASKKCIEQLGGSGSLMINTLIKGDMHFTPSTEITPFSIGHVNAKQGYIHVFDDYSLELAMRTLDTAPDFIEYLSKKEALFENTEVIAAGEEELIASYLSDIDKEGKHRFSIPTDVEVSGIYFAEGSWDDFCKNPSRIRQIEANKISYLWDELLAKFIHHVTSGTSHILSHPDINAQENLFRLMAKENRTRRRFLSEAILDLINKTSKEERATRIVYANANHPCYFILLLPYNQDRTSYEDYRTARHDLLGRYLYTVKKQFPDVQHIIGIGLESPNPELNQHSEDITYLDARIWTEEDEKNADEIECCLIENKLLSSRTYTQKYISEYPNEKTNEKYKGRHRNIECPCGSGKKFKKCCGK